MDMHTPQMFGHGVSCYVSSLGVLTLSKGPRYRRHLRTSVEFLLIGPEIWTNPVAKCFKPSFKEMLRLDPRFKA